MILGSVEDSELKKKKKKTVLYLIPNTNVKTNNT